MKVTVEEAKQEALKRMKKLNFHPNVLSDFKEDRLNKSELIGFLYWLNDKEVKAVKEFVAFRGDFISSDREAAAFMFALDSVGG